MPAEHPEMYRTYLKIQKIEDELKSEYYKAVTEKGEEVPSVMAPATPKNMKIFKDEDKPSTIKQVQDRRRDEKMAEQER